jgi:hypothetical protein
VLVVFGINWEQRVLGVGDKVTREQIEAVCRGNQRTLEVASAVELTLMNSNE